MVAHVHATYPLIAHLRKVWLFHCSSAFVFCFADRCHSKIVAGNRDWIVIVTSHTNNTAIWTLIVRSSGLFLTVLVCNQTAASSSIFSNCSLPQALISLAARSHNTWWLAKTIKENKMLIITAYWTKHGGYNIWSKRGGSPRIFSIVYIQVIRITINTTQHPRYISNFHWFSFHKLFSAVKASIRNHWFIYT